MICLFFLRCLCVCCDDVVYGDAPEKIKIKGWGVCNIRTARWLLCYSKTLQYEIIFPTALPERCKEMLNLYLYSDSRWDCLEIHLLPLKRIVWEAFKLIGKEFQNYCMRWVVDLFETNLKWCQIGLSPSANHCVSLLIHLAVTDARHILKPSKCPLVYFCNLLIFTFF